MAIDSRFFLMPSLQEILFDKTTGQPLIDGYVEFYRDLDRVTEKPVYEITGSPPNYSYVPLSNPVVLSGIGTFMDNSNNDIIPYMFPYDGTPDNTTNTIDLYYVRVYDVEGNFQFDREAWPNLAASASSVNDININYIPNGQFLAYNNIGLPLTTGLVPADTNEIAAGGWGYDRSGGTGASDFITFGQFGGYVPIPGGSPKNYCRIVSTVAGTGYSTKYVRVRFPDVNKFASTTQTYTFSFYAIDNSGNSTNVQANLLKNFGAGGSTSTTVAIGSAITITSSYQQFNVSFSFGVNSGKTIGPGDYVEIALALPVGAIFDLSFTDGILASGTQVIIGYPAETVAQSLSVSVNGFIPVPDPSGMDNYLPLVWTNSGMIWDDSKISDIVSNLTFGGSDGNRLYCDATYYFYNNFSALNIPYSRLGNKIFDTATSCYFWGTGSGCISAITTALAGNIVICANSAGVVTATTDGTVGTGFSISTSQVGAASNGYNAYAGSTSDAIFYIQCQTMGVVSETVGLGNSGFDSFQITIPGINNTDLSLGSRQVVEFATGSVTVASLSGKYIQFGKPGTQNYLWWTVDGAGSDPAPGGTGIRVNLFSTWSLADAIHVTVEALNGNNLTTIVCTAASAITTASYFNTFGTVESYYVWYKKAGVGIDPAIVGRKGIEVDLAGTETPTQVASATLIAINKFSYAVPDLRGAFLKGYDDSGALDPSFNSRFTQGYARNTPLGNFQFSANLSHQHTYTFPTTSTGRADGGDSLTVPAQGSTVAQGGPESAPFNMNVQFYIIY